MALTEALAKPADARTSGSTAPTADATAVPPTPPSATAGKPVLRARLFKIMGAIVAVVAIAWLAYHWLVGAGYVSTDDAYVGANVTFVTPQVAGAVAQIAASETQMVRKGDVLVRIDAADARLEIARAEAEYGRAVRRIRGYRADNDAGRSTVAVRDADLAHAQAQLVAANSDVERTGIEVKRRRSLAATGAVSGEEMTTALSANRSAQAARDAVIATIAQARASRGVARDQRRAGLARTEGVTSDDNPEVAAAKAALDVARLNLSRTVIRAPIDGMVARRRVQVGQRVAVGAELLAVVPLSEVYVDANFKEVQLAKVQPGQSVELTADRYGSDVVYHGRVVGVGGGTGSAFAVIPAQNATGNWIKVVQRLPVRIALDRREVARHPLRVGLSMDVTIDVRDDGRGAPR